MEKKPSAVPHAHTGKALPPFVIVYGQPACTPTAERVQYRQERVSEERV